MRFLKYEIPNKKLQSTLDLLNTYDCSIVIIGELQEGLTAIDVLWNEKVDEILDQYKVFPIGESGVGKHTFLGLEELYKSEL